MEYSEGKCVCGIVHVSAEKEKKSFTSETKKKKYVIQFCCCRCNRCMIYMRYSRFMRNGIFAPVQNKKHNAFNASMSLLLLRFYLFFFTCFQFSYPSKAIPHLKRAICRAIHTFKYRCIQYHYSHCYYCYVLQLTTTIMECTLAINIFFLLAIFIHKPKIKKQQNEQRNRFDDDDDADKR